MNHQLPEKLDYFPVNTSVRDDIGTVHKKVNEILDYLEEREGEKTNGCQMCRKGTEHTHYDTPPIKNGLVGQYAGFRINGKTYDADDNEVEEEHEADCVCCRKNLLTPPVVEKEECGKCERGEDHWHKSFKPRTITIPKPQWWENRYINKQHRDFYREALEACEKVSGIKFLLED